MKQAMSHSMRDNNSNRIKKSIQVSFQLCGKLKIVLTLLFVHDFLSFGIKQIKCKSVCVSRLLSSF